MDSLIELFSGKTTKKTFKGKTLSFTLRTLTTDEVADIFRRVELIAVSDVTKSIITRKYTVAYALEEINGVDVLSIPEIQELKKSKGSESLSKVDLLAELLGKFDDIIIQNLYNCYNQLAVEHEKELDSLKKEWTAQ